MGFTAETLEELERQVMFAAAGATQLAAGDESGYAAWEDRDGAALWIQVDNGAIIGAQPFFAGAARHEVRVEKVLPDAEHPLDGGARVLVLPDERVTLRVDVLNFALVSRALRPGAVIPMRLAAFAESISFYATEDEYAAANEHGQWQGIRWIVPTDAYPVQDGGTDRATALVTGVVLEAERRVNSVTKSAFLHLRLETAGFILDAVAVDAELPDAGSIAHGHFWLAAAVQPSEPGRPMTLR